jgi:Ni/Fe-hydrogenase subunit HybB-like protein
MALPLARREQLHVRADAMRPVFNGGRWFWPLVALLSLPVLGALGAWVYQLRNGLQVTGLNNQVFWGVYITNLITFIGFSYGGALVSAILRLTGAEWRAPITRLAEATALVTLVIGALFIFVDIGHPERVWQFITTPNGSSPLIWDALAVTTYLIATCIFLYLPLIPDMAAVANSSGPEFKGWRRRLFRVCSLGWRGFPNQNRVLNWGMTTMAVMIIPIAVTVHSVLSWAFALTSREGWHSTLFGPYFVIGALFSGVAMVILVVLGFRKAYGLESYISQKQIVNLGYIMLTLGLTYLYFTYTELLTAAYPMADKASTLLGLLLVGRYAPQFWFFVVGGVLVPVLLVALPRTRNLWGIGTAALLVVFDMWLKRFLIIVPPQAVPLIEGSLGHYRPTWVEILITLGGLAAIPLFLMLFFRVFPILSIHEIEEVAKR